MSRCSRTRGLRLPTRPGAAVKATMEMLNLIEDEYEKNK